MIEMEFPRGVTGRPYTSFGQLRHAEMVRSKGALNFHVVPRAFKVRSKCAQLVRSILVHRHGVLWC